MIAERGSFFVSLSRSSLSGWMTSSLLVLSSRYLLRASSTLGGRLSSLTPVKTSFSPHLMTSSHSFCMSCTRLERRLDHVGAADGLDLRLAGVADGDADAVAFDEPPAFVGDRVRDFDGIEAAVNVAGEGFELRPDLLLAGHLAEHLMALVARAEAGHQVHVLEEAGHGIRSADWGFARFRSGRRPDR